MLSVAKANRLQSCLRLRLGGLRGLAAHVQHEAHIVERIERREQMIRLKHEADMVPPQLREAFRACIFGRLARTRTVPRDGDRMQPRMDRSVVLPLPDGPISSVSSPPAMARLTPLSACTCPAPSPRTFTVSTASSIGAVIG